MCSVKFPKTLDKVCMNASRRTVPLGTIYVLHAMLRSQDGRVYAWEELRAFYVLWLTVWSSLRGCLQVWERQCCCFYVILGCYCQPWYCIIVFYIILLYCCWPLGSLVCCVHGRRKAPTYTKKQTEAGVRGHVCTACSGI